MGVANWNASAPAILFFYFDYGEISQIECASPSQGSSSNWNPHPAVINLLQSKLGLLSPNYKLGILIFYDDLLYCSLSLCSFFLLRSTGSKFLSIEGINYLKDEWAIVAWVVRLWVFSHLAIFFCYLSLCFCFAEWGRLIA